MEERNGRKGRDALPREGDHDMIVGTLDAVPPLSFGSHRSIGFGACAMEAVSHVAGEAWSDHPPCACPVIASLVRAWNDDLDDHERDALLRPLVPMIVGTRSTGAVEHRRAMLAGDWLVRENAPAWLRLAGMAVQAGHQEGCRRSQGRHRERRLDQTQGHRKRGRQGLRRSRRLGRH